MRPEIIAVFIPITLFIVITIIVKIVSDNRTRRIAIEKGMVNENLKYLYFDRFESHIPTSLKWGIVLVAVGLAGFIGQIFSYHISEGVTFSAMLIFGGLGLIVYYFIASKMVKKAEQERAELSDS